MKELLKDMTYIFEIIRLAERYRGIFKSYSPVFWPKKIKSWRNYHQMDFNKICNKERNEYLRVLRYEHKDNLTSDGFDVLVSYILFPEEISVNQMVRNERGFVDCSNFTKIAKAYDFEALGLTESLLIKRCLTEQMMEKYLSDCLYQDTLEEEEYFTRR